MPSVASIESVPLSEVYNTHIKLPSLKDEISRAAPALTMHRAMSADFNGFDGIYKRDDMLFLRHGQGTNRYGPSRDAARDYLQFPGMPECSEDGYGDSRSIGESDYEGDGKSSVRLPNRERMFPSFSPEPVERPQHFEREEQLGSSQRDVYDVSPPPGYKRLKRIRAPLLDIGDENMTVAVTMNQLLFPPEGHISRLQRSRRRQISVSKRHSQAAKCHHDISSTLLPLGDGFSGDETQPQKKLKVDKRARTSRAKPAAKRARRSREASDSSGSNQSTSLFQNSPLNINGSLEKRRKGKGDQSLSLLGSLDVVSLSQEDIRAAQKTATAALHSAEVSKEIATHVIPLRPMAEFTASKSKEPVSLGLDEPGTPRKVHELVDDDGQDLGEVVFDVVDVDGEGGNGADAVGLPFLPSLRC